MVVDRRGALVAANDGYQLLAEGAAAELTGLNTNAYRLALHPRGMAPRIANFPEWARHVVEGVRGELARNPDDELAALLAELEGYLPDGPLPSRHGPFAQKDLEFKSFISNGPWRLPIAARSDSRGRRCELTFR